MTSHSSASLRAQLNVVEALRAAPTADALIDQAAAAFAAVAAAHAEVEVSLGDRRIRGARGEAGRSPATTTIDLPFRRIKAEGVVRVGQAPSPEGDAHVRLLAAQVAIAVENLLLSERAEAAAAARRDLTSVVSHDLRAPLQTFSLGLGLVEQLVDPKGRDVVLRMRRNVSAMERLIRDIVEVTRLEQDGCPLTLVSLDVSRLVRDIVEELTPQVQVDSIHLEARVETPADRRLRGDMTRLRQAVTNLATHALKNTPKGGAVTISTHDVPEGVRFDVEHTGEPLPAEVRDRAFEPLVRGADGRMKGIGLGLFIARRIAEAHAGTAGVDAPPEQGNRFWITIPLENDHAQPP